MTHRTRILLPTILVCLGLLFTGCAKPSTKSIAGDQPSSQSTPEASVSASPATANTQPVVSQPPSYAEGVSLIPSVQQGPGNTAANLLHNGIAAPGNDGYIYHVDRMFAGNLWRTPVDGGQGQLLLEGRLHDLNVMGDVVFAIGDITRPDDPSSNVSGIVAVRTDGSVVGMVKEGYFEELIAYDQYLYYTETSECRLYRIRYDGSDEKLLLADIYDPYAIIDGMLYVMASLDEQYFGSIYRMPLDASASPERVVDETFGGTFDVIDGNICFIDRKSTTKCMFMYNTRTGQTNKFIDWWANNLNLDGQSLFYYWSGVRQDRSDMGLYRANTDGSGATLLINTDSIFDINIAGGKVFWHTNDEQRRLTVMDVDGSGADAQFVPQAQN